MTTGNMKLEVSVGYASMTYEIVRPLLEGRVRIEGVDLDPVEELGPTPTSDSRMITGDFGLCDLNMGYWLAAIDQGWDITGLPIFVKRKSAHWFMVVRNDRGSFSVIYLREYVEEQFKKMGDPFVYGIEANRRMLDWYIDISHEQGVMAKRYALDEVFSKGVLGT